jgi:DNA polymerase (family 10)
MELAQAESIAAKVVKLLKPYCSRIAVAGSIRRRKPLVNDIDLVLIPADSWQLQSELMKMGQVTMSGAKIQRVKTATADIDIYFATPDTWGTLLLVRTGSKEFNQMLATRAIKRGLHLAADGRGVLRGNEIIASKSEEDILKSLGLPYIPPEKRNG